MKVAFVNQPWNRVALPVRSGSVAIWTYEVARRLARSHEVVVYAKRDSDQQRAEWHESAQFRRVSVYQDLVLQRGGRRLLVRCLKKPLRFDHASYYLGYILRVCADLRRQGCDVVHIHNFSQFAPVVRALNPDCRIVLHMHYEWLTQIGRDVIEKRLGAVDRILGCSRYLTDTMRRSFPGTSAVCYTVHNGVDADRFSPVSERTSATSNLPGTVLFVGRVSPEKGIHILLGAFTEVLMNRPEVRLRIVGGLGTAPREFIVEGNEDPLVALLDHFFEGDYVAQLKESLTPEVAKQVAFLGGLSYLDLVKEYRAATVVVYPSVWNEPFGLPAVEAMACGVPVVATRSGGLQEIVEDNVTGILVERNDAEGLARAILSLLSDESLRRRMGKAGRERAVKSFSWEKVSEELSKLYQRP